MAVFPPTFVGGTTMAQISRIYFIQKDRKKPTRDTLFQRHTFTYMYTYMVSVGPKNYNSLVED
jgi:hypothetical protein